MQWMELPTRPHVTPQDQRFAHLVARHIVFFPDFPLYGVRDPYVGDVDPLAARCAGSHKAVIRRQS
jgi:hypothetical protein